MKIFKIDAQGDTVYVQAATEAEAIDILIERMGDIPASLLTITVVPLQAVPVDDELLNP